MTDPIVLVGALSVTVRGAQLRRDGGVSVTLEFRWDGDIVWTDNTILSEANRRAAIAGKLARHTGEDADDIERALSRLATRLSNQLVIAGSGVSGSTFPEVALHRLSEVQPETVQWLWKPYIPSGKVTLFEGDPGVGKSWITLALATGVSRGEGLPDSPRTPPAKVLLLTAEDGLADTIRPRLDALGADVSRIHALDGPLALDAKGLAMLESHVAVVQPALVVLDPLVAYLGGSVDLHRANETRVVMAGLAAIAERCSCAVVGVRHLAKGGRDRAIYRGMGSIDLTAACRSVLLVGCDPQDKSKRAMVQIKNNLAPMGGAIGYEVIDGRFRWTGSSDLTVARILAPEAGDEGQRRSVLNDAVTFLQNALADGPQSVSRLLSDANGAGITKVTLDRAKARLGIRSERQGNTSKRGGGEWRWRLPQSEQDFQFDLDRQDSPIGNLDVLNQLQPNSGGRGGLIDDLNHSRHEDKQEAHRNGVVATAPMD